MPDFGYSQFKAINFYLATPPHYGNWELQEWHLFSVLKWFHNMWIQGPLIDFTLMLHLKGSTTQFGPWWNSVMCDKKMNSRDGTDHEKKEHFAMTSFLPLTKYALIWVAIPFNKYTLHFGKHSIVQHIDTILSTVLLKATGYKTLTSSRGRAVHWVESDNSILSLPQSWTWRRSHVLCAKRVNTRRVWCDSNATDWICRATLSVMVWMKLPLRTTNPQNRAMK